MRKLLLFLSIFTLMSCTLKNNHEQRVQSVDPTASTFDIDRTCNGIDNFAIGIAACCTGEEDITAISCINFANREQNFKIVCDDGTYFALDNFNYCLSEGKTVRVNVTKN